MSLKKDLDKFFGVTDYDIDQLILDQKIEEDEQKIKVLKELIGYKSFEDYANNHEEDFEEVEITDDFKMIIIPGEKYPDINLEKIRKIGIIAEHFGIYVYIDHSSETEKVKQKERFIK
jgi:hypothetical protein